MLGIGLDKIIAEVDNELNIFYHQEAFQWARSRGETRWSDAFDEFDLAVATSTDPVVVRKAAVEYRDAMVDLFKRYKQAMGINDADLYLENLRARQ